ncbi:MAG: hypothetical protein KY439_09990 [Actinobacteria bacterium]|nr:hypothetical protein [Actinomycetota bacterium]
MTSFDDSDTTGHLAEDVGMTSDELREETGQDDSSDAGSTAVIVAPPD